MIAGRFLGSVRSGPRHETEIGGRFAGRRQLVYLIEAW